MNRIVVLIGVLLVLVGLLWKPLSRLPLFRLPGDFVFDRPGIRFFFPLTSMIVISVVVSLKICWSPIADRDVPGNSVAVAWEECRGNTPGRPSGWRQPNNLESRAILPAHDDADKATSYSRVGAASHGLVVSG